MVPLGLCFQCEQAATAALGRCESDTFTYLCKHNLVILTADLEGHEVMRWTLLGYRDKVEMLAALRQ